ncbi:hypothetical protein BD289DRAFT_452421 [Coniella lustricola]|uniref:Uncharacterized protein n=1 Tax=Coniella lustricola TaxID=2025994 RepID=A0A2T3ABC1_9PEZI|nr:hypothetical protein BD289DRAFT_452421 [Coniella lustricola]
MELTYLLHVLTLLLAATITTAAPQLPITARGQQEPSLAAPSSATTNTIATITTSTGSSAYFYSSVKEPGGTASIGTRQQVTTPMASTPTNSQLAARSWHPFTWPSNWPFIPEATDDEHDGTDIDNDKEDDKNSRPAAVAALPSSRNPLELMVQDKAHGSDYLSRRWGQEDGIMWHRCRGVACRLNRKSHKKEEEEAEHEDDHGKNDGLGVAVAADGTNDMM